jgi:DNA excision repair protein ERCC-3
VLEKGQIANEMRTNADLYRNKGALHCKNLKISLKAFTKLREYQSESLKAVIQQTEDGKVAKSGYIVLPCGAGKTLLGIAICAKVKKETLIVCSSDSGA